MNNPHTMQTKQQIPIIDTHTHLCDDVFAGDLNAVLGRAGKKGIVSIIAVSETIEDARKNIDLAKKYPIIKAAAGIYPKYADLKIDDMFQFISIHRESLLAIGEVGLDFWLAKEEKERTMQRAVFQNFIDLSRECDLPLNIHSRSAGRHAIEMLRQSEAKRVQLHAFDGKWSTAMKGVDAGYYFSIPPSIVRSRQKQKLVKSLPLENILLETDSPVLGADPEKRNEPANIYLAAHAIADIKKIPVEKVTAAAYKNTLKLYGEKIIS